MKGAFPRCAEPRAQAEPGRKVDARSAWERVTRRAVPAPRARVVGGLEVKVPLVEPFTRPLPRDATRDGMGAELAQADPDEIARLLALLRESTVA